MKNLIKRWLAKTLLTLGYGFALIVSRLFGPPPPLTAERRRGRILVIGTFHNPNWFFAHLEPLARCSDSDVVLVADGHTGAVEGLRVVVPNPLASKILSRAGAKFLWSVWYALRHRPDLYMGYAIFPAATTALILGRLFRRPACFQVTSGKLELEGGGNRAENKVLSALGSPSPWIEKLAFALTRQFDLLIVRGGRAERYIRDFGATNRIDTITGSVAMPADCPPVSARTIDVIFVGRLTERKRPDRFIKVMHQVARDHPGVRAAIVGDGPDTEALQQQVAELGLDEQIEFLGLRSDVLDLQLKSRIFALTSRWEGVSIAMLEAMSCGTIPVVSDVGDLRDVVDSGKNGFVFDEDDIDSFATTISALLADEGRMATLSREARQTVEDRCSRVAVSRRWGETLRSMKVVA
ncbi:MAG: glycosyltransferase family 4 protein [Gammaproteobacteria bacterium]|nr:glycosyltransferase family 4 protein [Gammaproteobacteria bacterium]